MIHLTWRTETKRTKSKRAIEKKHEAYFTNAAVARRFADAAEVKLSAYDFSFEEVPFSEVKRV